MAEHGKSAVDGCSDVHDGKADRNATRKRVTDKVGGLAAEIADLDSQIEQITAKSDAEEAQLADWIAGIRDPRTRLVFRLRFFRALSWKEIAKITHTTTDTVKAIVYRYLREETRSTHGAKEGA